MRDLRAEPSMMPVVAARSAGAALTSRPGQCGSLSHRLITGDMTYWALFDQHSRGEFCARPESSAAPAAPEAVGIAGGRSNYLPQ